VKSGSLRARESTRDWTGQTLYGRWTVERLIGVGGTSTVLQARHRNGRRAALKVLHPHLAAHGHTRERFLREGRLANLVSHPGVVAVLDDFTTDDGTAVLVLELVQGKTLAALARELGGALDAADVVAAAETVLDILAHAHDANVIHRDIKPENILRCASGEYKLADFGLAALHHELGMLTGTNAALGTPAYMAPEQARGDTLQIDARTDIWGLGATMFTLLTGRFIHSTSAQKNLVVAAATEEVPPALSIEPSLHPPLAELIDRAVCVDKEERWPNARAMLAELRAIALPASGVRRGPSSALEGRALSTVPSTFVSWDERKASRPAGRPRMLLAALFAIAAIAGILALSWRSPTPSPAAEALNGPKSTGAEARSAALPSPAPAQPAVTAVSAVREPPRAPLERSPTKRMFASPVPLAPKTRAPLPSATAPLREAPREVELAVPDDVLDRRE
jgi:eukaryotic-like serine/threonine-protein kinase